MGVHGLWRLIDPAGKPVPLETLENKVLAVDVSIWLHQAIKGFQDSKGAPIPNAHLLGIFHRVCKLLYYRIQPVFVFDGGVPALKKQTIAKRSQLRSKNVNDANQLQKQILNSLLKHSAVNAILSNEAKASLENSLPKTSTNSGNMFELPSTSHLPSLSSSSEDESDSTDSPSPTKQHWDLHTIDEKGADFKSLPVNVRHEILTELKGTRKQSSWGRIHELPTESNDFSGYQMKRLLKRYSVQATLEETEKEMGGTTLSLGELETLLTDHGVIAKTTIGSRIASDENKRYLYIKSVNKAMEAALALENSEEENMICEDTDEQTKGIKVDDEHKKSKTKADLEYEEDLKAALKLSLKNKDLTSNSEGVEIIKEDDPLIKNDETEMKSEEKSKADLEYEQNLEEAIRLSLQDAPTTSKDVHDTATEILQEVENYESNSDDNVDDIESTNNILASAKSYMIEYSGLTPAEIAKVINKNSAKSAISSNVAKTFKSKNKSNNKIETLQIQTANVSNIQIDVNKTFLNKLKSKENDFDKNVRETIENITIDSDSDDSNDFLEVSVNHVDKNESLKEIVLDNNTKAMEIVIDKTFKVEDDLFNDIFESNAAKEEEISISKSTETEDKISELTTKSDNVEEIENKLSNNEKDSKADKSGITEVNLTTNLDTVEENGNKLTDGEKDTKADKSGDLEVKNDIEKQSELLNDFLKDAQLGSNNSNPEVTKTKLQELKRNLTKETKQLINEKSSKERLANNITDQMCQEAQELLQLFGVPYVIAPMEAEAQCAFFNEIDLTDGTITDDSDIWLFGGKTVYKNFFNQSKHVLEFKAEDIERSFKLSRNEMILLALLVGSDYTNGVQGIGPVTALEIIAAFPPSKNEISVTEAHLVSGLREFRKWFKSKSSKPIRHSLRNKLKNIELTEQFPSLQVIQAYLEPTVETSKELFSWEKPDVVTLIDFAKEKFGWNQKKSEEILKPIIKRMEEKAVQTKITNYFKTKHKISADIADNKMSKRVKMAVNKLGNNNDLESDTLSDTNTEKTSKKRSNVKKDAVIAGTKSSNKRTKIKNPPKAKPDKSESNTNDDDANDLVDEDIKILAETRKMSRRKTKEMKIEFNEMLLRAEAAKNEPSPSQKLATRLHRKEVVPQKEKNKAELLKSKMKAIEVYRKSKHGPGFVKKSQKVVRQPKEDAELSENSDS